MSDPASNSSSAAFLLFKLRHIGDVLLTTPSIRLLRRSFPRAHITMVVNKGTEDVLCYNPHLNEVLTVDRATGVAGQWRLLRALRRRRYAASVDFASGDRAAWLAFLSGVPRRIALWSPEGARRMLNNKPLQVPASPFHIVELYLSFVERGLALHTEDRALELPLAGMRKRRRRLFFGNPASRAGSSRCTWGRGPMRPFAGRANAGWNSHRRS